MLAATMVLAVTLSHGSMGYYMNPMLPSDFTAPELGDARMLSYGAPIPEYAIYEPRTLVKRRVGMRIPGLAFGSGDTESLQNMIREIRRRSTQARKLMELIHANFDIRQ